MSDLRLPPGYVLMEDSKVKGYSIPDGFRLIRRPHVRMARGQEGTLGGRAPHMVRPGEWLKRLEGFLGRLKEESIRLPQGTVLTWGRGKNLPRRIAEEMQADKRWLYLRAETSFIRLADAPFVGPLSGMVAGDFVLENDRTRDWGYSSYEHMGWGRRVKVRLPEVAQ